MKQLVLFQEVEVPKVQEPYTPGPDEMSNKEILAIVETYNATGEGIWTVWPAIQTASRKIVNKRLGRIRVKDKEQLADEVALQFFERLQRYRKKGSPYRPRYIYTVLYNISTGVLYADKTKQSDREVPSEKL